MRRAVLHALGAFILIIILFIFYFFSLLAWRSARGTRRRGLACVLCTCACFIHVFFPFLPRVQADRGSRGPTARCCLMSPFFFLLFLLFLLFSFFLLSFFF
ncbi:hypothetical protein ABFS83_07G073900 [Erythranthe nasuta]